MFMPEAREKGFEVPSPRLAVLYCVPALLYFINNNLSIHMQMEMDPASYQVRNTNLFTATLVLRLDEILTLCMVFSLMLICLFPPKIGPSNPQKFFIWPQPCIFELDVRPHYCFLDVFPGKQDFMGKIPEVK
jgi:hypothetical protein